MHRAADIGGPVKFRAAALPNHPAKPGIKERKYLMSKKLITACMALVALAAFALPAVASASPQITHPTGTRLNPETGECTTVKKTICIKATNVGETLLKDGEGKNTLTRCTTASMTGYLTKNTGTEIEADIHTATFSGTGAAFNGMNECTSSTGNFTFTTNGEDPVGTKIDEGTVPSGTPYCLTATNKMAADEFQIRGGTCSESARKITFIFDVTNPVGGSNFECKYERAEAIKGTYTTDTTSGEDLGKDAILSVKPANSKFTLEAGGNILCPAALTLEMSFTLETDTTPEAAPLYIS